MAEGDFYLLARQLTPQARERDQRSPVTGLALPLRQRNLPMRSDPTSAPVVRLAPANGGRT